MSYRQRSKPSLYHCIFTIFKDSITNVWVPRHSIFQLPEVRVEMIQTDGELLDVAYVETLPNQILGAYRSKQSVIVNDFVNKFTKSA